MNVVMWVIAGGILGWVGYAVMRVNVKRGMMLSVIIGVVGGFFGGSVLAPMFGAAAGPSSDFSMFSLLVALASAAAWLAVGNLLSTRFGV